MPWRQLSALARRYGVLSLVDGAHLIGQLDRSLAFAPEISRLTALIRAPRSSRGGSVR